MRGKVYYSSERIYRNCHIVPWHTRLIDVTKWIIETTEHVVFTSGYRPLHIHDKDSGIHITDPLRAVDIRHWIYPKPGAVRDRINKAFEYDPMRPGKYKVAYLHDTGLGMHFHIQVHNNTKAIWEV